MKTSCSYGHSETINLLLEMTCQEILLRNDLSVSGGALNSTHSLAGRRPIKATFSRGN